MAESHYLTEDTFNPTPEQHAEIKRLLAQHVWPPPDCDRCKGTVTARRTFTFHNLGDFLNLCKPCAKALGLAYDPPEDN